jgi:pimeloyl-ACP methyl ester carboxylesterase
MAYAAVNGIDLYYERHGAGPPLVLLHGGLMTIELNFGELIAPLAEDREVIGVELQGHGHTALGDRPMSFDAMADDVVGLLDHLALPDADVFGYSLGGLVGFAMAIRHPERIGRLIAAVVDPYRPADRPDRPIPEELMPTQEDFRAMRDSYAAVAPDPSQFDAFAERTTGMVHQFGGWYEELTSMRTPTLLVYGDRDLSPLEASWPRSACSPTPSWPSCRAPPTRASRPVRRSSSIGGCRWR